MRIQLSITGPKLISFRSKRSDKIGLMINSLLDSLSEISNALRNLTVDNADRAITTIRKSKSQFEALKDKGFASLMDNLDSTLNGVQTATKKWRDTASAALSSTGIDADITKDREKVDSKLDELKKIMEELART